MENNFIIIIRERIKVNRNIFDLSTFNYVFEYYIKYEIEYKYHLSFKYKWIILINTNYNRSNIFRYTHIFKFLWKFNNPYFLLIFIPLYCLILTIHYHTNLYIIRFKHICIIIVFIRLWTMITKITHNWWISIIFSCLRF